jgi:hypothetical protein
MTTTPRSLPRAAPPPRVVMPTPMTYRKIPKIVPVPITSRAAVTTKSVARTELVHA